MLISVIRIIELEQFVYSIAMLKSLAIAQPNNKIEWNDCFFFVFGVHEIQMKVVDCGWYLLEKMEQTKSTFTMVAIILTETPLPSVQSYKLTLFSIVFPSRKLLDEHISLQQF